MMTDTDPTASRPESQPCPEGFHFIGQAFTACDKCGLPAWDHDGMATLAGRLASPFDTQPWVLEPWKPGEREAVRQRWDPRTLEGQTP
jgi:hypothetical protein